jgi:hypothetical protein
VIAQDGMPAPIVSPDPRAFAIHKMWLSKQDDRDPAKKIVISDRQRLLQTLSLKSFGI